ncbi:YitT family protein, partial [bacterium]|nr:YitT family protein [bacterium]
MGLFGRKKRPIPEQTKAEKIKEFIFRYITLTLGSLIVSFALDAFLIPNKIIDGGVIGVSM